MPRRPRPRRPKLTRIPGHKAPPLWNLVEGAARGYPLRGFRRSETVPSFPPPPPGWTGTLPEWAIFWALEELGLRPDVDFSYRLRMPELEVRRWGEVDFLVWSAGVGIEVQGEYWHYLQGPEKAILDQIKAALLESAGFVMVWIDAEDALASPLFYTREALAGRDYSRRVL